MPFNRNSFPLGLAVQGVLFLMLIATVLHILDRQGEFVARTDFIWKAKLKVEQEEVETMRGINKVRVRVCVCVYKRHACFIIINSVQTRHDASQRYYHHADTTTYVDNGCCTHPFTHTRELLINHV